MSHIGPISPISLNTAVEVNSSAEALLPLGVKARLSAYVELTKPRITFLIMLTSAAGFCLGSRGAVDYVLFAHAMIGIGLLSSGIATLNQFIERDLDGLMRRTADRPLPSRRLVPDEALWLGVLLTASAEMYLALFVNGLSAILGLTVIAGYLFLYTPLKTRTTLSTAVGAFPGAMPPLIGWTAARGEIDVAAWVLFAILFLWQFPHFLAIALMYREDYLRAGYRMLPEFDLDSRFTRGEIVAFTLALMLTTLLPAVSHSSAVYFGPLVLADGFFLYYVLRLAAAGSKLAASRVLHASVVYLPIVLVVMALGKR